MKKLLMTAAACIECGGCAGGTPGCADVETLGVLDMEIFDRVERLVDAGRPDDFIEVADAYEFSNIRLLAHDASTDSYQCDARVTYTYRGRSRHADFTYRVDTDQASGEPLVEYQKKMLQPIDAF